MYGIWCFQVNDWIRELPSKVDDGGVAVLAFDSYEEAKSRAAKHYGYLNYAEAKRDGHCVLRLLADGPHPSKDA